MATEIEPAEEPRSDALLLLRGGGRLPVGRDRIAMLQAVAAHGSITAAARALGYSYKTVWAGCHQQPAASTSAADPVRRTWRRRSYPDRRRKYDD